MKTINKEIKLYEFKELPEDIQKEKIKNEAERQENLYCDFFLEDDIRNEAEYLLEEKFNKYIKLDNLYYDFGYSYGDGVNIEFNIDVEDLNKIYNIFTQVEIDDFKDYGYTTLRVYHYGNRYYSDSVSIGENLNYMGANDRNNTTIEDKIDTLKEKLSEDVTEINSKLRKYGYDVIEDTERWELEALEVLQETTYTKDGKYTFEDINNL